MEYIQGGKLYSFDYQELREEFHRMSGLSNKQFRRELPAVLHFAVYVCWVKGLPASVVLADDGIIHQLVHLLHLKDEPIIQQNLRAIRALFDKQLELV